MVMLSLPIIWLIGQRSISKIVIFFVNLKAKGVKGKYLFCARRNSPDPILKRPIGFVVKEEERGGKKYYNVIMNLAGITVIPDVPEEDLIRVDKSPAEVMLIYLSLGTL